MLSYRADGAYLLDRIIAAQASLRTQASVLSRPLHHTNISWISSVMISGGQKATDRLWNG
jgi:hypothetical protein